MATTDRRTHTRVGTGDPLGTQNGVGSRDGERTPHARNARRRLRQEAALLVLTTGGPTEVLARLCDGDPLGLATRLVRRAAARALLVSPERLFERGAAHCARRAGEYRGRPRPELWLERRAEEVVRAFEREGDRVPRTAVEGTGAGAAAGGAAGGAAARRASALERAAARFNACPRADRDALWRLAFAGQSLDQQAHDAKQSLSEMARRARRALDALLSSAPQVAGGGARSAPARGAAATSKDVMRSAVEHGAGECGAGVGTTIEHETIERGAQS